MKTLIASLGIILLTATACNTNNEQEIITPNKDNNKTTPIAMYSSKNKENPHEKNTYFEEDIHAFYLENTLQKQFELKEKLIYQIENGNDSLLEELEYLQQSIKNNQEILEQLYRIRPVLPSFPPKPRPCDEKTHCKLELSTINFLVLAANNEEIEVKITTIDGEPIGGNKNLFFTNNFEEYPVTTLLKEDYSGEVILEVSKFFIPTEEKVTYKVEAFIKS